MASPPFRVKALYDYASPHDDDLSFPSNQIINVTDEEDSDWYYGEYEDSNGKRQEGLFPKNFVKIFEPETPPRPSRTNRPKKDIQPAMAATEAEEAPGIRAAGPTSPQAVAPPPAEPLNEPGQPREQQREGEAAMPAQAPPKTAPSMVPHASTTTKPPPPVSAKPAPAQVSDKPSSGSFRDRINAFNKSTAPPVAPMKPSGLGSAGGSGFVKKPFVAPPPSKNAYVPPPREPPPQKAYRREEDPEIASQTTNDAGAEEHGERDVPQAAPSTDDSEDQPKPTSLKDRIALLQKQQMEQAARHADSGQKKEKPKRPSKKHTDPEASLADQEDPENEDLEVGSAETMGKRSTDVSRDTAPARSRSTTKPRKSREGTPVASPAPTTSRELFSDGNDADQSGAGDTEGEEASTGREDSDEKPGKGLALPQRPSQAPPRKADTEHHDDNADEEDEDEEEDEDVDPEVKRKMEIRERMAKMSGGMGMAGMFGPPGAIPPRGSTKQGSASSEGKASGSSSQPVADSPSSRAPPVPVMAMPGLTKVRSPEQTEPSQMIRREETSPPTSISKGRDAEAMPDEDLQETPNPPPRRSIDRPPPPPVPQDRPVPGPPGQNRAPPPVPSERPVPPPPNTSRPVPPPPPSQLMSPSEGSESDDELSSHTKTLSLEKASEPNDYGPMSPSSATPPLVPSRPPAPPPRHSNYGTESSRVPANDALAVSPTAGAESQKRNSRVPPIPGSSSSMPGAPQSRAPPPPPPNAAPPSREIPAGPRAPPSIPTTRGPEISSEEVTEYDGDYDTDMASGATHKDALKSHARVSSLEDDSMTEEASLHHSGLPSIGPSPIGAPRAVPPPPPNQPPRPNRRSSDMPRAAPPLPPAKEPMYDDEEEYDPYRYTGPGGAASSHGRESKTTTTPMFENPDMGNANSPPQRGMPPSIEQASSDYAPSPNTSVADRPVPRQSSDIQRTNTSVRRSTDQPRQSSEQGYMASDVDLGQGSLWWTQPNTPPPVFQNRRDVIFETEGNTTTRRGGKQAVTRDVYILFMDYSQTIVTAHFEAKEPTIASLEQRHESPPRSLRQDQLEEAHSRFGSQIAEGVNSKKETVVGDGTPHALPINLMSSLPDALRPVGVRAYGALVYANLANASVQQYDEIRSGDIVTFRNSKFQGHRGPMHSKYSFEVGKPDHVGVVVDWDGTKKKVRAWEQGREGKKVKMESFKFGDMKSGEVKVWRVMSRSWVGWEGQN